MEGKGHLDCLITQHELGNVKYGEFWQLSMDKSEKTTAEPSGHVIGPKWLSLDDGTEPFSANY